MSKEPKDLNETQVRWAEIIAKAWTDEAFKKKLLTNPQEVLKECGLPITPKMKYMIHENTEHLTHLVLPSPPTNKTEAEILSILASGTLPNN
jgi:hypothetical protein